MKLALVSLTLGAWTGGPDDKVSDTGDPAVERPPIGTGDGTPESVGWTFILGPDDDLDDPRDLGFDTSGNLWIANREDDRTFIVFDPGTESQEYDRLREGYAQHFMEETAALSFDDVVQYDDAPDPMVVRAA